VLIRQGENARELIIIVEGTVRVERSGQVIAHQGPGEVIGEMGLVDGRPRSATVITESPSTILVIEAQSFWPLIETMPQLSRKLMATLSERVRTLETRYID
jgi:CRP/FNR family transcriptional regulator, cyclic AMP receptor protein